MKATKLAVPMTLSALAIAAFVVGCSDSTGESIGGAARPVTLRGSGAVGGRLAGCSTRITVSLGHLLSGGGSGVPAAAPTRST